MIPLLITAAIIVKLVGVARVWATTAMLIVIGWSLQIVGYIFDGDGPLFDDSPLHMLMSPTKVPCCKALCYAWLSVRSRCPLIRQASDKAPEAGKCGQGW